MTYKETLDYLYNVTPAFEKVGAGAYKEGLSNTLALDEHFGHPHHNFLTIHVAGTNGKGSTSHTLAAMLISAGYKVGLYTSPHIIDFSERIKVNGTSLPHQYVIDFVEQERHFFEPLQPSFFELTTAMAFKYFAEQQVDIAVIEVGLGGRLDCTNIITPILSIITNISFDHTQFLGNTLAQIASEKAGIMKPGVPVIIGEATEETRPVFTAKANEVGTPIIFAEDNQYIVSSEPTEDGGRLYHTRQWGEIKGELGGLCQEKNTNTILNAMLPLAHALHNSGILKSKGVERGIAPNGKWSMQIIREAFSTVKTTTGIIGRWQKIADTPLTICDTGHNVGGWQYLSQQISMQKAEHKHIIFGMVDDKDIHTVLDMLPKDATYYFTQADTHRAIPAERVSRLASEHGLSGMPYLSVHKAYRAAIEMAQKGDFVFIGGSSYVVSDFLTNF